MPTETKDATPDLRDRIHRGARLQLDTLSRDELTAMAALIRDGEAEIINEVCKPFLVRALGS